MHGARLYTACLALAVAVCASTGLLSDRLQKLLVAQSASALGGDLLLRGKEEPAAELRAAWDEAGLEQSLEISLPSVVYAGELSALAGIRAVDAYWPLRGQSNTEPAVSQPRPAAGTVWVEQRLADLLRIAAGDTLEVGRALLRVEAVVAEHPGRGNAGFTALAPQLLMAAEDLSSTGLLVDGARSRWNLYLAGPESALEQARIDAEQAGQRASAPAEVRPEIGSALQRIRQLLQLATLGSLALLAAVVFLLGRVRLPAWEYEIAVLRSLGAQKTYLLRRLLLPWLRDTALGLGLGLVLAWVLQKALDLALLQGWQLRLPAGAWEAYPWAATAGAALAGVMLPTLLLALRTPPARLHRGQEEGGSSLRLALAWSLLGVGALALVITREASLLLAGLSSLLAGALLLALIGLLLLRLLPLGSPLSGPGQLRRQGLGAAVQLGTLGLGIGVLLLIGGLQQQVILPWQERLPEDAPNRFVLNIQPGQEVELQNSLTEAGIRSARIMPMVRGRLIALDDQPVRMEDFDDPDTQRWIARDFNLSSAQTLPADNELIEGRFWEAGSQALEMSVDVYAVERLGVGIGSSMTLDIAGQSHRFEITSIREVHWDSLQPNFFLLVPDVALPAAQATWLTSYHLPPGSEALDRALVQRFPNLTVLDLDALIREIRTLTSRALLGLQLVFGFTLLSGAALVLAMLLASLPQRRQTMAILRALGMGRPALRRMVLSEFALLGGLAGLGAALLAQLALGLLAAFAFNLPWVPSAALLLWPPLLGALISALLGWSLLRPLTLSPPGQLLRGADQA